MHGVKFLAVVLVVLQVGVGVSCGVPNSHYIVNVITKEIVFTQKKKPAAPIYGMAGFFIMLLRSRNHGKSSG